MTTSQLVLSTAVGVIEIEVHEAVAPSTTQFVRRLVEAGHFDGAAFYRSTRLGVDGRDSLIQGGPFAPVFTGSSSSAPDIDVLEVVESTSQTGMFHRRGTVSLARDLIATGHVLPELFICLDDYPELDAGGRSEPDDHGFPAFGYVTAGLDVATAIASRECGGASPFARLEGELLTEPVPIISATLGAPTTERT